MSERAKALLTEALSLSDLERLEIADALYESLDPPPSDYEFMTEEEFVKELERRHEELRLHPERAVPLEEVIRMSKIDLDQ